MTYTSGCTTWSSLLLSPQSRLKNANREVGGTAPAAESQPALLVYLACPRVGLLEWVHATGCSSCRGGELVARSLRKQTFYLHELDL